VSREVDHFREGIHFQMLLRHHEVLAEDWALLPGLVLSHDADELLELLEEFVVGVCFELDSGKELLVVLVVLDGLDVVVVLLADVIQQRHVAL